MQIIRTALWVLLFIALLVFSINNWATVEVKIWEGLILETKLPALVVGSFLAGLVPMWLLGKAAQWRLNRRITALENANRSAMPSASLSSTQLAEADPQNPAN